MNTSKLNRIIALAMFAIAQIDYFKTLSDTVVFWDVGEFMAAANLLQVPHPPGAPLFLIVARVASMIPLGAYQLPPMQRQALKLLTALPGGVLLSQRDKVLEAFEPVFEAAPYTMIANVTGQPSMSLPLHWTADGLPMGMLFTARIGDEATLFRLAAQLEQAMPWRDRSAPHAIP